MITSGVNLKNFKLKKKSHYLRKKLKDIIEGNDSVLQSLRNRYKDYFNKNKLKKYKTFKNIRIIGMGGSSLGTQAVYDFFKDKINKNFSFLNNLNSKEKNRNNQNFLNLIVSKSGNTIETIINSNIYIKKKDKNIFITENKRSYLYLLAQKVKSEIIHHNNFIGGRYSVLSEVGMLPAELMGLNPKKFRQLNHLVKNKKFLNAIISSVNSTLHYIKKKKFNSVIINYDPKSENLFSWYQQLVAESLGKNNKGLLPIVSNMPKDNHSVMQLYLDGFKNNFFTFFYVHEKNSSKIINKSLLNSHNFIKNRNIQEVIYAQKTATENIFKKKNLPFRSFEIKRRDEKTLGELFCFFILETILIGKALKIDPYNQPAVESIKKETKKILI